MPRIAEADRLEFAARARSLFISGATVEWFLESATPGQLEACSSMLARELESRERSKRARLLRQARFPVHKTLEGFDWSNVGFPDGWGRDEMLSLGFAAAAEDLVLHGPTGRGKTHVATALGIEATARGIPVRFYQTASLVLQLGKAKREGTLDRLMAEIGRCGLVVLDEFGYVPFDVDGARLLYQVIADSYERRSIVFTTNIEFSRWGTVFADDKLAAAIVDRVVHHGRLVEFGGPSHRLEHALMLGKGGARMNARQAMDWLEDLDPEAEIAVTAKFPGLDGWRVTSWAVSTGEAEGCPSLEISVEGTDFDYPAPSRALLEVLPDLLDRLLEAEDSGYL